MEGIEEELRKIDETLIEELDDIVELLKEYPPGSEHQGRRKLALEAVEVARAILRSIPDKDATLGG